jgi:hypothetical protein
MSPKICEFADFPYADFKRKFACPSLTESHILFFSMRSFFNPNYQRMVDSNMVRFVLETFHNKNILTSALSIFATENN